MQLPSGKTVGNIDEACRSAESDDEYTSFQSFKNRNHSEEVNIDIIDSVNEYTKTYFNKVIGFRSLMQVKEFTRFYTLSGGIRKDAIDMQLVSKFVPKLKLLYSEEQKDNLYMLIEEIKELFKKDFNCKDSELDELMIVKKLNEVIREIEY